jgi:hypothetical protein
MTPRFGFALATLLLAGGATAQPTPAPLPGWMSGSWCSQRGALKIEELWLAPSGGLMLGLNRGVNAERGRTEFEFLRIELREGLPTYLAQPQGRPAVAFVMSESGEQRMRFENRQHDFPQRIEYSRVGDQLRAVVSGPGRDGNQRQISFEFAACPAAVAPR